MKHTGRYCHITHGFDIDEKINEVASLTEKFIKELIEEVGVTNYKKLARVIINEHLDKLVDLKL